eukprot:TRINITY_DN1892_c3_g1_i1.p1 TRINITY_DN1892_c3_g1~~TRINITY_DN1892_c3_g1_i1.p1  ORF type:complete len:503 (+),score=146.06 TRINITY_DN1892_c3_g1_i1:78-1586(+)
MSDDEAAAAAAPAAAEEEDAVGALHQLPWHSATPWWWNPEVMVRIQGLRLNTAAAVSVRVSLRLPPEPVWGDDAKHPPEDMFRGGWYDVSKAKTRGVASSSEPTWGPEGEQVFFKIPLSGAYNTEDVSSKLAGGLVFELWQSGLFTDTRIGIGALTLFDAREKTGMDPNTFSEVDIKMYPCGGGGIAGLCGGDDDDGVVLSGEEMGTLSIALRCAGMTRGMVGKKHVPTAQVTEANFNVVTLNMPPHTTVKMSPGCARAMSSTVRVSHAYTIAGGTRILMTTLDEPGELHIGANIPGRVIGVELDPDEAEDEHRWILTEDAWVAHTHAVRIRKVVPVAGTPDDRWTRGLEQAEGKGVLCFAGQGQLIRRDLEDGETFMVDGKNVLAWQWRTRMRWHNVMPPHLGLEPSWFAQFRGPGTVLYATRKTSTKFTSAVEWQEKAEEEAREREAEVKAARDEEEAKKRAEDAEKQPEAAKEDAEDAAAAAAATTPDGELQPPAEGGE